VRCKSTQNAFIESFNGRLRDEIFNETHTRGKNLPIGQLTTIPSRSS
jgi:hypothetical protein